MHPLREARTREAMTQVDLARILEVDPSIVRHIEAGRIAAYPRIRRLCSEIFKQDSMDNGEKPVIRHFCLEVDDIDEVSRALTAKGYKVGEKKLGADQSYQAWTSDPAGVAIEFHQYTENSSQMTGKDCEF